MRYFVIFLILIGFFSSANAIQYQSSETDKPVNSKNSIHVIPEVLWDIHEVILDGTIVEYNNNTWTYHIKINHVFKGSLNSDLISAEGFDVWNYFEKGDRALFYLYDISPVSANYKYKITDYSVKTSPVCDARSLIQISPILPNDPNRIVRGHPNIPADWEDPCVPDYFSYDPDFFNFREVITPLKQLKHKIPIDKIRCYDDKVLLFRNSNGSPACVTEQTKQKLVERGWTAKDDSVSKTSINCWTLEQSKETTPFFKTPTYLPEGYSHVCSQSGTPFESYIVYYNQEIPYWNIPELVSDGAIFIYQIDERSMLGEQKVQAYGSPEQRIQETYDDVMKNNPSLNPQLITINEMLAYAVDSCPDCGMQTANFTDGTSIQESTSTKTRIKFIDDNGVSYMLETTLPLQELIKVAKSLQ